MLDIGEIWADSKTPADVCAPTKSGDFYPADVWHFLSSAGFHPADVCAPTKSGNFHPPDVWHFLSSTGFHPADVLFADSVG